MKTMFKPLGIAAAVAAVTAGYSQVSSAQQPFVADNALGNLALVPYYTVNGEWITGIHIVNTSPATQVVKFRFRRAPDSIDALDFNVVMSPYDVYAGFLSDDASGNILWSADDNTCTVPETTNGSFQMPSIYREGAETGYVEIIGMGQPVNESQPIAINAEHSSGVPVSCDAVRSNFFANGSNSTTNPGVQNSSRTWGSDPDGTGPAVGGFSDYDAPDNVLKVSYFIRDNASGIEFGDNAVHIKDLLFNGASMTNQEFGYLSGDLDGFDFPDLDGAAPTTTTTGDLRQFRFLRSMTNLGVSTLINEWSANAANGAAVDWVVTMPGQYLMLNRPLYLADLDSAAPADDCEAGGDPAGDPTDPANCDFRDIPVVATVEAWNREELSPQDPSGQLVISPSIPGAPDQIILDKEVNVITFGGQSVLGVSDTDISADVGQPFGWLSLAVSPQNSPQAICNWDLASDLDQPGLPGTTAAIADCDVAPGNVPMIGFAAWARSVAANPDASYGRIIGHSFTS